MDRSTDVAFFLPDLSGGGGQRVTLHILRGLAERGFAVDLVVARREGALQEQVADDVAVRNLGTRRYPGIGIWPSVGPLVGYLRRAEPDALVSGLRYTNTMAVAAGRLTDTPVLPTEHTTFDRDGGLKTAVTARLARQLFPRATQVVSVSEGIERTLIEHTPLGSDDVTTIYNPVVTPALFEQATEPLDHPWFDDHEVVLGVGRLEPEKDFESLLRAFERLHTRRPESRLVILGAGSRADALERVAAELDVADIVDFAGFVGNPYNYMREAAVLALTSRREGLPTVLIEALACGTPVVSTDCPHGPSEILAQGAYGLLTPVGDDDALASALEFALRSSTDRERLRARAADFDAESITEEYVQLLQEHTPASPSRAERREAPLGP